MNFGEKVRQQLKSIDKDEVWLSNVTNIPLNDVCDILTPENQTINHLIAIIQALGISPNLLLETQGSSELEKSNIISELQDRGEQLLMDQYRQLNEDGQERLLEQAEFFVSSGRYIKNYEFGLVS